MEYIEGQSLKDKITERPLKLEEALEIVIQITTGLQKSHEKNIVHRDIKPANILFSNDGVAKIVDFGIAKLSDQTKLTKDSSALGTVAYMSPEQTRGDEVDHRTDIWSLGIVLYEMITGVLPFKGDYEQAIQYSIVNEEPEPITGLRTGMPLELERIVNKALSKNKDERYQHVDEFLVDLKKIIKNLEYHTSREKGVIEKTKSSIAVLPFRDMSPQKDQDYFCEGIAEELMNALVKVEGLKVASRTAAFQFEGKGHSIRKIGMELNVNTVLEGSVRKAGNRLRITAQLVNVADGFHIWSEKYDRDTEDIFTIQDEISLAIVDNLKLKLLDEDKVKLIKRYTDDSEAYDLYLKGRYFWIRRYEGGLQKGLEYFNQTIKKDPSYAPAYAGIADSLSVLGLFGWLLPKEAFPKAKANALKAIEIDDMLAEAYTSLGWITYLYDWDWTVSEKALKRALEIDPYYAIGHFWYALYLTWMSRFEEATTAIMKALELEPLSLLINVTLGLILYFKREYDEAIEQCLKTHEMETNYLLSNFYLGLGYIGKEMWKEAISVLEKAVALSEESPYFLGFLGFAYGISGQKVKARKTLQQLNEISKKRYVAFYYRALIYFGLGEKDQLFKCLERAYKDREPLLVFAKSVPLFDSIRSEPKFSDLLKKIGLE